MIDRNFNSIRISIKITSMPIRMHASKKINSNSLKSRRSVSWSYHGRQIRRLVTFCRISKRAITREITKPNILLSKTKIIITSADRLGTLSVIAFHRLTIICESSHLRQTNREQVVRAMFAFTAQSRRANKTNAEHSLSICKLPLPCCLSRAAEDAAEYLISFSLHHPRRIAKRWESSFARCIKRFHGLLTKRSTP